MNHLKLSKLYGATCRLEASPGSPRATTAYLDSSSGNWCCSLCRRGMGHCHRLQL